MFLSYNVDLSRDKNTEVDAEIRTPLLYQTVAECNVLLVVAQTVLDEILILMLILPLSRLLVKNTAAPRLFRNIFCHEIN